MTPKDLFDRLLEVPAMRKKVRMRSPKRGRARISRAKSTASTKPRRTKPTNETESPLVEDRFVNDLMVRGEAAKLTKSGKLPLHATHVIKKQNPDGSVEVERVRYKTF